jgi:hypothetical protein
MDKSVSKKKKKWTQEFQKAKQDHKFLKFKFGQIQEQYTFTFFKAKMKTGEAGVTTLF